ncbi:MAG: hypothetical protein AAGJ18_12365 [Bacteroidota bacterium]
MTQKAHLWLLVLILLVAACRLDQEHFNILPETESDETVADTTDTSTKTVTDTTDTSNEVPQDTTVEDMNPVDMNPDMMDQNGGTSTDTMPSSSAGNCTTCIISTIAGTGEEGYAGDGKLATETMLNRPWCIVFDAEGNLLFSDRSNHRIRKIDAETGVITTIAGVGEANFFGDGGRADKAFISYPSKLAFGPDGQLYFADDGNGRIRRIDLTTNIITTFAGNGGLGYGGDGGPALEASFYSASSISFDAVGNAYIGDKNNNRVRRIDQATSIITTVAGNGIAGIEGEGQLATEAQLDSPTDVAFDEAGNMYIVDQLNSRICRVDAETGILTTIAGVGEYLTNTLEGLAIDIPLAEPRLLTYHTDGNLYVAMNTQVRQINLSTGIIKTVVGGRRQAFDGDGGPPLEAGTYGAVSVTFDEFGNMYIGDRFNHRIRKVTICETGEACW